MFDVVLDLKDLSIPDLIIRATNIATGVTGQAAFASLAAQVTAIQTKIAALQTATTAAAAAKEAYTASITTQEHAESDLRTALSALAKSMGTTATTQQQVEQAGARLKSTPASRPVPAIPQNLAVTQGDEDGEVTGQCDGQPGMVDYYDIRVTTGDPNSATPGWQVADSSKKSSFELKGMPTGALLWVQVRAANASGKSAWSDPARVRVP